MMRTLLLIATLTAVTADAQRPGRGGGAGRPCTVNIGGDRLGSRTLPSGNLISYFGGNVVGTCGTMRVQGDSAEYSEDAGVATIIGRARYSEEGNTVESNRMRYFEGELRVEATGNVRARSTTGTTLNVDQLNYYRKTQTRDYTISEGVGHSRLVQRDSVNVPDSLATVIVSNRLRAERDSLFYAGGNVVITRSDLQATADSAATISTRRRVRLIGGKPTVVGRGGRSFNITGTVLDIFGKEKDIERLLAQGKATAISDSLHLSADTIDINTTDGKIDRVALRGPGRTRASSPGRDITAAWIDVSMPGQQMRELVAIGRACVTTKPDSTILPTGRDWIDGDTVVATFDSLAKRDSTKQPPLRALVARGSAGSYYHLASKQHTDSLPTINYVTGARINAQFADGVVRDVRVFEQVRGLTLEPIRGDSAPPRRTAPAQSSTSCR